MKPKDGEIIFHEYPWEIREYKGRVQPFTVWRRNEVYQFCKTKEEAVEWIAEQKKYPNRSFL